MKRRIGILCVVLGAAFILAALSLFAYNQKEDRLAGAAAAELMQEIESAEYSGEEAYIGYISIPALELKLPVMSRFSYDLLKTCPCRYYGSAETADLVIAAHNYTRHFGNIRSLSVGDAVYFTDTSGVTGAYAVAEIDILSPYSVEEMTGSGYALTLFTCTYGGRNRVAVRCSSTAG